MIKQPESFFRKVGQSLGLISAPAAGVDHLVKRNLSPSMGRRDAAIDQIRIPEDLFARPAEERCAEYRRWGLLLESAGNDTTAVLRMLSSPDTRRREGRMASMLTVFQEMAAALFCMADSQVRLAENRPEGCPGDMGNALPRCESMLLNEFREIITATRPALDRYREYTVKSFGPENLQRYRKAYDENSFHVRTPGFTEGV